MCVTLTSSVYWIVTVQSVSVTLLPSSSVYSGHRDAESLLDWTLRFLPDPVTELVDTEFLPRVLDGAGPWLVDFYTPWCGHCQLFAPKFQLVARVSDW